MGIQSSALRKILPEENIICAIAHKELKNIK